MRTGELHYGKRQKRPAGQQRGGWASGVGYGHQGNEGGPSWDIATAEAAQAQQDIEMRELLGRVTSEAEAGAISADVARDSCLRTLLWQQLRCGSLLDIGSRPERALMFAHPVSLLCTIGRSPAIPV